MSKHDPLVYLGNLLDKARRAREMAQTVTKEDFDRDDMVHHALTFLVRQAGEFARKVPVHVRDAHPEVEWVKIEDLRNVVGEELKTDYERVWRAVREDFPVLIEQLLRFTPSDPPEAEHAPPSGAMALEIPRAELVAFCEKWNVRRLALFGSVVRDDFGPESDVDVLVEFHEGKTPGLDFFSTMPEDFARLVGGREVDLVTFNSINRWASGNILAEAVTVYAVTPPEPPSA